jgi:hypothetical protein
MPGCARSRLRRVERSRTKPRVARSRQHLVCSGLSRALRPGAFAAQRGPRVTASDRSGGTRVPSDAAAKEDWRGRRLSKSRKPCGSESVGAGGSGQPWLTGRAVGWAWGPPGQPTVCLAVPTSGPRHDLLVGGTPPIANAYASGQQERDRAVHSTLTTGPRGRSPRLTAPQRSPDVHRGRRLEERTCRIL